MKVLAKTLLALYILILLWLILLKFSFDLSSVSGHPMRKLNLIPFAGFSPKSVKETIANFAIFIPLGLLLSINLKRATFWRKLAFVLMLSLAAEMMQFVFAIGITDITDVITNTSGGSLGLLLYALSHKYAGSEKRDRLIVIAGTILLTSFLLLLGVLFSHGVRYRAAY